MSIARALMNGGRIILADEPTGALDSHSGEEVMRILKELNAAGHTVIIVTHDPAIAAQTERVIEIRDGEILRDSGAPAREAASQATEVQPDGGPLLRERLAEAFKMAMLAMSANRLRTALTMLGIVIGIASVVSVIAIGEGSRDYVLKGIREMGTQTITVFRGKDWGTTRPTGCAPSCPAMSPRWRAKAMSTA
ncbi:Macrolide export ATP-binding/permease protein MacB [Chromobacterium violaceum]|uniref:Macrolide export ATP-binding/permease protein MacB n=1 Tax=Chromobacterium violaceum TaxID=536 RepID=A0A447TF22_CHRVL|nr:Macrolide export ATP-binding/permease protein MacB [Chromobacterium violaceum]